MPSATIDAIAYNGSLASLDLLSGSQTLLLSSFGGTTTGTFTDDDNSFDVSDSGTATFNGDPVNYIGSGTAQPGIEVLGIVIPLGTAVDVVVFEAGGQIYFYYPDGEPNALDQIAVVIDITADPYEGITPVCFCPGAMISTPNGERAVETLRPGDVVLDVDGETQEILWVGKSTIPLHKIENHEARKRLTPIRIHADAFGRGRPYTDLDVSPQHRILLEGRELQLLFGLEEALCPAKSFVGRQAYQLYDKTEVTYIHILCREHCVLLSNGLPTETLLLGTVGLRTLTSDDITEILSVFPELRTKMSLDELPPAFPLMNAKESMVLSHAVY